MTTYPVPARPLLNSKINTTAGHQKNELGSCGSTKTIGRLRFDIFRVRIYPEFTRSNLKASLDFSNVIFSPSMLCE